MPLPTLLPRSETKRTLIGFERCDRFPPAAFAIYINDRRIKLSSLSRLRYSWSGNRDVPSSSQPSSRPQLMTKTIRKAVFPVAGLGTRFLPATKAIPKEMLTVVDRPVIQHVVDEARAAGIEHFVFVTGRGKAVIEDHFDINFELDRTLAERGKTQGTGRAQGRPAGRRADQLHAPAGAAGPRPRRVVRARHHRRRALRRAAAGHAAPGP